MVSTGKRPLEEGLVLHLPMNEGVGDVVYDRSGERKHGAITGASWENGMYGKCLSFNGLSDKVDFALTTFNLTTAEATFSFWAKRDDISAIGWIITRTQSSQRYIILHTNGNFYIETNTNGDSAYAPYVEDTDWHMYTITAVSGTIKMFQDIEALAMIDDTVLDNIDLNVIGNGNLVWYKGLLEDFRIYNHALALEEIKLLFTQRRRM